MQPAQRVVIESDLLLKAYLLEYRWQRASFGESSPSRDRAVLANQEILGGRQADGTDVRSKLERLLQSNQRQIVLVRVKVVFGMNDFL